MSAILRDTSERHEAEQAQRFLAAIVESSEDAIAAVTPEGVICAWNRGAETIFGYSAADAIGKPMSMLPPPERRNGQAQFARQVLQGNFVSQYEGSGLRRNGRKIQLWVTGSPVKNAAGEVVAISLVARDTTERRRVEGKLRESEGLFREVFEHAPVGMCIEWAGRALDSGERGVLPDAGIFRSGTAWQRLGGIDPPRRSGGLPGEEEAAIREPERMRGPGKTVHSPQWSGGMGAHQDLSDTGLRRRPFAVRGSCGRHHRAQADGGGAA